MNESAAVLERAVSAQQTGAAERPNAPELVTALQTTEKSTKARYALNNLVGTWRLHFITGTKKTRKKAGVALGAGRYLPKIVKIQLTYQAHEGEQGSVQNSVRLGQLKLELTGPVKFWPKTGCLAFDFTQIQIAIGGLTLYQGRIKPEAADQEFYRQTLKEQAFFKYFWVTDSGIAARGRGGGLALWYLENSG
ncbi:hypothetical protein IQ260_06840 [Leptolyngbya cf. ectocarpi LEGE 11479]|uniref:Plastid lipid-associated protein/fibrillin conserved domain-containing protein n=1 Tax=Leptolyngbya cf. ectocarpi LEGE 11479 TaxID=1828722 RepID=A0A928X1W9_LEPEC|nr:PAP/fibrillin family protein [Leptolyngbya ectocarpi]MBE9066365.1 hypothetical protein [Leptolyngbya cf. ectocarpi LEGE 11479]